MANQVRIEYDPYQQKASYQIRDSSSRKFAKIPKSDLGNPDNHKYHDGMLDEIVKYAIPELQEKRLAKELVFCGTEDDFQDFKDALVRFYERNPDTTWNMTLLRDETSYYRAADTVKSEINAIFQGIVDTLTEETMVAECYRKWQECQNEVYRTYKDTIPEYPPLSGQKEFKSIKNMVISEAVKLGNGSFYFDDAGYKQRENYIGVETAQQERK